MKAEPHRQSADPLGLIGQIVAGRFRVTSLLGRGGFGVVYRAEQLALERTVALKVQPLPDGVVGAAAERLRQELKDEARTVARLRHPHIVEVFDFGVSEGASGPTLLWMAMEWLDGQTLEQALASNGRPAGLPPRAALDLLRPVLEAITHAHAAGVVHRDLKPANVLLVKGPTTVPKVLDFGIAKWLESDRGPRDGDNVSDGDGVGDGHGGASAQTTRGFAAFSPDYAAPEQISHSRTGPFTDVHALGLMLTEVLTGRSPYEAVDAQDRYAAVVDRQRPTPGSKGVDVGAWEGVLARALARRPADRFQDAGELLQALEGALRQTAAPAAVVPAPEAPARRTIPDVLPAKLLRPQTGESVPRPRLWKALDRLGRKPITWVQGPGGAGKTTLISSYLGARGGPVLWYEVDAGDADPGSVYHYLRLGAQAMVRRRLALPTPRPGSPESQRIFARRFFESLFAQLPAGTRVVFDNYQEAALAPGWNETFRELASVITPRVRVLVASRSAPPPTLARVAASGELQLLDWQALRFDEQEIRRLVKVTRGSRKGGDATAEAARLGALTDGWAVAVSLLARTAPAAGAAASGRVKRPRPGRPGGDLETVFAFLASEILARLDGPTRQFLQQVSVLPSFTPEMAAELTGRSDSTSVLSRLYGDNLLIEWRGEDEFSLHQLFRMFLQAEARRALGLDGYKQLASQAGALLARAGDLLHAGELLAAGEAWPELAALIEQQAPALAEQGRLAGVGSALQLLPPALREERPWLVFWEAVVSLGHPGPASPTAQAQRAFERLRQAGDPVGPWLAWALAVQAIIIEGKDFAQLGLWLTVLEELGAPPAIPPVQTRVAAAEALAFSFFEVGTARALAACERALDVVWRHGSIDDRILVSGAALMVFMNSGRPDRAREMVALTRRECSRAKSDPLPRLAFLHAEAAIAFQSAEFRLCIRAVDRGLALARESGIDVWNCSLLTLAVLSARAHGDFTGAERLLEQMAVPPDGPTFARGQYMFCRGLLAVESGQAQAGVAAIREADRLAHELGFKFVEGQGLIALVISEFYRGNAAGVQQARARLEALQAELPSPYLLHERRLLDLYMRLRGGEEVSEELRRALADERESGMCSGAFLGHGVMAPLLEVARRERIEPALTARLTRAFGLRPARPRPPRSAKEWR